MAEIHPTAIVEDGAVIAEDCKIGPMCFVGRNVKIGAGTELIAQCHITGYTTIGENNLIYPFAALGCEVDSGSDCVSTATYLKNLSKIFSIICVIVVGYQSLCQLKFREIPVLPP